MLTVYTGLHRHAGTKSKIGFMIIDGKNSKTDVNTTIRQLEDKTYKVNKTVADDRTLNFCYNCYRQ